MTDTTNRVERIGRLRWLPVADMKVNPVAQRELNQSWVDAIVADFDPERIGYPVVNSRGGSWFIIDGQHRIEAIRQVGWGDQKIQCDAYEGLTEAEEAEMFLKDNNRKPVPAIPKFRAAVTAEREVETDVDRIVRSLGLVISKDKQPGAIGAATTLIRVYRRDGSTAMSRSLQIIRDSFGDPGMEALVINGLGMLCSRFNGELDETTLVTKLSGLRGGVTGLTGRAEKIHKATGSPKSQCVAAAAVEVLNQGRGRKLPSWWRTDAS